MSLAPRKTNRARALAAATALMASLSALPFQAQAEPQAASPAADALTALRQRPPQDEVIYFLLPDRFANGDAANDRGGLDGDRLATGFDPTSSGFYNGGDIAGLRANLDYIKGLGTTAIWLTPSFANKPVQGEGDAASAGYHGYWITDFTRIDPHLGTNAELEAFIDEAHAEGIDVYFDIITNHTADVISYAEGEYSYVDQETSPYRDADGAAFDPADYAGTGDFPQLDPETSFPYTPVVAADEADIKVPAWLNDVTLYHNRGDSTYSAESTTYGDFAGLDDLMTEHPDVVNGFVEVYEDWIDLGIDGFRIDTAKHVDFSFWEQWTQRVLDYAHAQGKDDFFMFGEVYDADPALLAPYVRRTDMNSVLDFGFQSAATSFAKGGNVSTLANLFAGDDRYTTTDSSATALPTFLGNHDMGRIGYFLKDADDALEATPFWRHEGADALDFGLHRMEICQTTGLSPGFGDLHMRHGAAHYWPDAGAGSPHPARWSRSGRSASNRRASSGAMQKAASQRRC
jgi:glycosidase